MISYKHWKQAMDKWELFCWIAKRKDKKALDAFDMGSCGYCRANPGCHSCALVENKLCGRQEYNFRQITALVYFNNQIGNPLNSRIQWKKILELAEPIRDFIKGDEPKGGE